MPDKSNPINLLVSSIKDVEVISLGSSKESLPEDHLAFPLKSVGLYFGIKPGTTPEQQFHIREKLNDCIVALDHHSELAQKYTVLKRDSHSLLEASAQSNFESQLLQNLATFLGNTDQFGVVKNEQVLLSESLSEHTVKIISLQLASRDEHSIRVSTGELYACRYEGYVVIVERSKPLSETEKKHIKLTLKYITLQQAQASLDQAMKLLLDNWSDSDAYIAHSVEVTLQKSLDNLVKEASVDPLTLAFNRRYVNRHVENLNKQEIPFSVIITDIDHFKKVNDTFGHDVGDQILCEFVDIMNRHSQPGDIVGRWGGEEFIMILQTECSEDAIQRAEKIRSEISVYKFSSGTGITASFGVSNQSPAKEDFIELVREADKALYRAKQTGRNRVELKQ
ncbi:GGDEF domain-containing protein [Vibrio sp. JC009]|uniref:GGDEF domain-containing protein n=1 Tax=Vibrio sp. JC009 TaxID=2912314 RepID=UPI0023AEA4D5|nr:GGDEF domain-containing protein [Vibrio sp. JC009]WED20545.1 GGDEF domain-containing protein [Vibrio sp. JC009]